MRDPAFSPSSRRSIFRRLVASLALIGLVLAQPVWAASMIDGIVVKYRDSVVAKSATTLPAELAQRVGTALQGSFLPQGRQRDGAFKFDFAAPLPIDAARAALNRVRMDPDVLYAELARPPSFAPDPRLREKSGGPSLSPPTNRMVVKYRDPALSGALIAGTPLDRTELDRIGAIAGTAVAFVRPMSDGASVLQLLQRLPVDVVEAMAARVAAQPDIEWAQPDYIDQIAITPTDPCYATASSGACNGGYQWDLQNVPGGINAPAAWDITTGSASLVVAVIDTGALFSHPDLTGRFVGTGYDMVNNVTIANDGDARDGNAADPGDWVTSGESNDNTSILFGCPVSNSSWHGSHVAGTIGAAPNNGIGVAGINWMSKLLAVRVLGKCGGFTSDIADGMTWASGGSVPGVPANANPARVMNLSIGGFRFNKTCDPAYSTAIATATANNAVVVIAAGNSNYDSDYSAPGNCAGVITVAATGEKGFKSYYSNWGAGVEIAAPGGDSKFDATNNPNQLGILSTRSDGTTTPTTFNYTQFQGTSMATPHVVGVVSLMLSANPALTPSQVLSKLQTSARPFQTGAPVCDTSNVPNSQGVGSLPPSSWFGCTCTTSLCGAGFLDAYRAVSVSVGANTTTNLVSSVNPSNVGQNVTFTATVHGIAPAGTVNFKSDSVTIGGCVAVALTGSGDNRNAACSTTALASGGHSIVATYSGDSNNNGSANAPLIQNVGGGGGAVKKKIDFDGNGKHDIVWSNSVTGQVSLWLMNGLTASSNAIIYSDAAYSVTHTGDLSGDGKTDLIWRHTSGATVAWLMNGLSYTSYATLLTDPNWVVQRLADFNGDGMADILWRNTSTGATAIWLMNGLSPIGSAVLLTDPNWSVTQVADFNGDGKADLLWRNSSTGATAIWLMNGTSAIGSATLLVDPNWTVTNVGDFDGDGKYDLLWRNSSTGQTAIWLMNGVGATGSAVIFTSLQWQVTHVGDFNFDGKDDLVWRNASTGQTAVWLQNGLATTSSAVVLTDTNWQVTHVADTNGDGKSDLIWRNTSTGMTTLWLMNGTGYSTYSAILADPTWSVSPANGL